MPYLREGMEMTWWQMASFVCGGIFIVTFSAAWAFLRMLVRQEKRDGLR